jgi:hypothetical protein
MEQILHLSHSELNFTVDPEPELLTLTQFHFQSIIPQVMTLLSLDQNLARLHARISPKMNEEHFWRNYYARIFYLRYRSRIDNPSPVPYLDNLASYKVIHDSTLNPSLSSPLPSSSLSSAAPSSSTSSVASPPQYPTSYQKESDTKKSLSPTINPPQTSASSGGSVPYSGSAVLKPSSKSSPSPSSSPSTIKTHTNTPQHSSISTTTTTNTNRFLVTGSSDTESDGYEKIQKDDVLVGIGAGGGGKGVESIEKARERERQRKQREDALAAEVLFLSL